MNLPIINAVGQSNYNPIDANLEISKPIQRYYHPKEEKSIPLKTFRGQDLEMFYME
jgi:hypothetical protein